MKLLIDECLHTSLVTVAHLAGHSADHVSHRGLGGLKDWQLMGVIRDQEYTFVTNDRSDFVDLHSKEPLHAGVIVIVPNVIALQQRELLAAALKRIGTRDLTNTVVEVRFVENDIQSSEYELPRWHSWARRLTLIRLPYLALEMDRRWTENAQTSRPAVFPASIRSRARHNSVRNEKMERFPECDLRRRD